MSHQLRLNHGLNLLLEFASFPSILRYDLDESKKMAHQDDNPVMDPIYFQFLASAQSLLKPFKGQIDQFYYENELYLVKMLLTYFTVEPEDHLNQYLMRILQEDEETLKTVIVYSCLVREHYVGFQQGLWDQAKATLASEGQLMPWVQTLPYAAETKWHLLNLIQQPKISLSSYQQLMMQLQPHFEAIYEPYANRLLPETQAFIEKLQSLGPNPISTLTVGIVKDDLIPAGPLNVSVSFIQAYHIQIFTSQQTPIFIWGYKTEAYIAHQKKLQSDASTERILVLKNLGDKTRFHVAQLVSKGTSSTKVIAEALGVTPATVSYHLNQLVTSRIIVLEIVDGKYDYVLNREYVLQILGAVVEEFS